MMKNKYLILLGLVISTGLIMTAPAKADNIICSWQQLVNAKTLPMTGDAMSPVPSYDLNNTLVCPNNETSTSTNICIDSKPSTANMGCCCINVDNNQLKQQIKTAPLPQFDFPKFQIKIPTVNLTKVVCSSSLDGTNCTIPWISEYIFGLYSYVLNIAAIVAAIILMIAGLLWIVSGGDAGRIGTAKKMISGSIIGLFLLVASNLVLRTINPDLINQGSVSLKYINTVILNNMAENTNGNVAKLYKSLPCPSDNELTTGINFYSTGYYKPNYENTDKFFCVVAMQCSCPNGQDSTKNCDEYYRKTYPGYHPCNYFPKGTDYCNHPPGLSGKDIAGPSNCENLKKGTTVCFDNKTYTIKDTGGGIKGRRIDIWSGNSLQKTYDNTKIGVLKSGPCK